MSEKTLRIRKFFPFSWRIAWPLFWLLLPLTSFPLISKLMGGATVAPASAIPLAWLALTWAPWAVWKRKTMPREVIPLVAFVMVALFSSALAFFGPILSYKGHTLPRTEFSALLTLGIGAAYYLIVSGWNRDADDLRHTLRWLNIGGMVLLAWSLIQTATLLLPSGTYPAIFTKFQHLVSTQTLRDPTRIGRITGFTFEPSWLAHELNLVYLPFWLACTLTGNSAHRIRIWKFSIENLCLAGGVVALLASLSRVGLAAFGLVVLAGVVLATQKWSAWLARRAADPARRQKIIHVIMLVVLGVGFLGGAFAGVKVLSRIDPRLQFVFSLDFSRIQNFFDLAGKLAFAERVAYWDVGWRTFGQHPLLGVGLGNSGFYAAGNMSEWGAFLPEIQRLKYHSGYLLNVKSFWVRLLSETGLAGFSVFAVWFYLLLRTGWVMRHHRNRLFQTLGLMGVFILLAFMLEGFSVDSFAMPYLWVGAGLLSSAAMLARTSSDPPSISQQDE